MAKITIEELSDSLKEQLNNMGLTEEQVQELIDSFEEEKVGELTNLNTTNKENLVAAINEVFQSGNNVKQNLVDALIAKGVSCSTSDSFSKLISLIYGLTHSEGSEGSEDNGNENLPSFEEENTWSTCNSMTVNRYALASAVVDKKIYVIGGYNSVYCNTLEVYDTELGIWETKRPMPTSLAYLSAETVNGQIYVLGGSNSTTRRDVPNEDYVLAANGKYRIYDPPTDTWTEVTKNMPIHQYESNTTGTSTAVIGDTIYFAGGHGEGARYNTIGSFNVTTGTTTLIGDQYGGMQNTGMAHSALCAIDGKLYRFGGKGYGTNSLNNTSGSNYILTYDPSNPSSGPTWLTTYMPITAHSMGYCVVNKKVYLIGGIQGSGTFYNNGGLAGTVHNTVYEYEPYTNKWNKVNTMLTPRFALTAAVVDNIIYCIGGMDSSKVPSNAVEAYCPPGVEPPTFSSGSGVSEGLNIISTTELPTEGIENQICVITDNPVETFIITNNINDINSNSNDVIYIPLDSVDESSKVVSLGTNVVTRYHINSFVQGENRLASYIYRSGAWEELTVSKVYFVENNVERNKGIFGGLYSGDGWKFTDNGLSTVYVYNEAYKWATTNNTIDFSKYNTMKIVASQTSTNTSLYLKVGIAAQNNAPGNYSSGNPMTASSYFSKYQELTLQYSSTYVKREFTIDISGWTTTGHLGFMIADGGGSYNIAIHELVLY